MQSIKLLFMLVCLSFPLIAQNINATLTLNPYPSPYVSDWENNPASLGSLTIFNNSRTGFQIVIRASVALHGMGEVFTSVTKPIQLNEQPVQIINNTTLISIADASFKNNEYKRKVEQSGRLLEGVYSACLTIENTSGVVLATNVCSDFTILYPAAPQLIFPVNQDSIDSNINYPTFEWIPVIVPPAYQIKYTFRIVEVLQGQTPSQAIDANIPVYENNQLMINILTYPIDAFPLTEGKQYAWQVQALDQYGLPPTQNQGRSEIFTFVKKKKSGFMFFLFDFVFLTQPSNNAVIETRKPDFKWTFLPKEGESVKFQIKVAPVMANQTNDQAINNAPVFSQTIVTTTNSFTPTTDINFTSNSDYVWRITALNAITNEVISNSAVWKFKYKAYQGLVGGLVNIPAWCSLSGMLHYKYSGSGEADHWALANKTIKLVVKYVLKIKSHTGTLYGEESPKGTLVLSNSDALKFGNDADQVLDIKTTDANGNFKFDFINSDSMAVVKLNYDLNNCTSGENCYHYYGDVYRVARILVDDKYYLSPDDDIIVQPWENKNIGTLYSQLKSYTFEVTIKPNPEDKYSEQFAHQPIDAMDVYILRKSRPSNLPSTEGKPKPFPTEYKFGYYEVIGKTITGQNGKAVFSRLIVNINDNDQYYLFAESNADAPHNYLVFLGSFKFDYTSGEGGNQYVEGVNGTIEHKDPYKNYGSFLFPLSDNSVFNAQYSYPYVTRNFYAYPLLPEIKGRIVRSDESGKGIENSSAILMKIKTVNVGYGYSYSFPVVERNSPKPSPDGDFAFKYLNVEYSPNSPYPIVGPVRSVILSAPGFKDKWINIDGQAANDALTMGQRVNLGSIGLDPAAVVHGFITDEYGNGINAKIKIGDSPEKSVNIKGVFFNKDGKLIIIPGEFEFPVAKLNNQPLVITPIYNPASYIVDTTYINITQDYQDLGTLKIYKKLHRIRISVLEETTSIFLWPPVPNAKVKVEVLGSYLEKTTDQLGQVEFEFSNDATTFKIIVEAPEGKYYEKRIGTIFNVPSKYPQSYTFSLKKATFISGNVFVADNKPVPDSDVWIDLGNPDLNIFAKTNQYGEYLLKNVPIDKTVTVFGSKTAVDTTIIGDSISVYTGKLGLGKTGVNLYLKIYNGMDITKLLGFPVLLTDLNEDTNGNVTISGMIKHFNSNGIFAVFDSTNAKLNFSKISIKAGTQLNSKGIPYAELSSPPVVFDDPVFNLKMFNKFSADLGDVKYGVQLDEITNGNGVVKGKTFINSNSFNTQGSMSFNNNLFIAVPDGLQNKMIIPSITADGSNPISLPKGFNVVNDIGNGLNFTINSFSALADPKDSYFNYDTVRLRTTLFTNIQNASPSNLNLQIGDVVFHQVGIDPINGDKEFSFQLDSWNLSAKKWFFNKGPLTITEGTLKTGADIPIKSLAVTPTTFQSPDFDFKSLLVSGIVPLTINGSIAFDYNNYKKYWYVSVSKKPNEEYSAYFKGLPGMETNVLMKISNFEMTSKESFFSLTPVYGQTLKLYKVGILNLGGAGALLAYDDYLWIPGLSFDIPKITQSTSVEYFKGSNGSLAFRMKGLTINTNSGNGVYMQFGVNENQQNTQVLDDFGFRSRGFVGEEGKFEVNSWLFHTIDSTSILVETPSTPYTVSSNWQTLKIGASKTYLDKLTGGMKVFAKNWSSFHFEGDLAGTKGVTDENKRLAFTVYGEIKADNQKISLKNIDTPFGGMSWTYEFENSRLIGNMDIHQNLGGIQLDGTSELLIDGDGWYFLGGGTMQVPGVGPGYAATLFGDYPTMTASVKQKFAESSYKKSLPNSFQSTISGFLFSGAMSIPLIVPHIGINLKIVDVEFGVDAGGDIKVYKGFDEGGSTYGLSALAFIHAFLTMKAITCTELSADAVVELGFDGNYQTGSGTFNLDGCGGFGLGAHLTQKLWGCDLDGCGCMGTIFDEGFDLYFKALMHLDSSGGKSLSFAKGKCSD